MTSKLKALMISAAIAAGASAVLPAGASADAFTQNCDATAVQASVLVAPALTLGTANLGQPACKNDNGTALSVPAALAGVLPVDPASSALQAQTTLSADKQNSTATGGLANLGVGVGSSLPLSQITGPIVQAITGSSTPTSLNLGGLLQAVPILGVPLGSGPNSTMLTPAQIQAALNAIVSRALKGQLLSTGLLNSTASASCASGQAQLSGSSNVASLNVLGQDIPLNGPTTSALSLFDTTKLGMLPQDLLDGLVGGALAAIPGNPTLTASLRAAIAAQITPQIQAALAPLLKQLQALLGTLVQLKVDPNEQTVSADGSQLTQQALHLNLTLNPNMTGGLPSLPILDLAIGQARIAKSSVTCPTPVVAPPPNTAASQAALACSKRNLELIDVVRHGRRTFIQGAAKLSLVGRSIPIFFGPKRKQVATAIVQPDGFFRATAPLPPKRIRNTNKARYFAKADGQRTLRLKFHRRMIVSRTVVSGGNVVISGKISRPLAKPIAKILIQRRVTCTSLVNVSSIKPSRKGKFTITVAAPPGAQVGVYRAKTVVRKTKRNPKRFPTFTLPRFVTL